MKKTLLALLVLVLATALIYVALFWTRLDSTQPDSVEIDTSTQSSSTSIADPNWEPSTEAAVEVWEFYAEVLGRSVGNEDDPNILMPEVILLPNGTYRMYYNAGGKGTGMIKYAESANGLDDWEVQGVALEGSSDPDDWDYVIGGARVLPLADGGYRMYYRASTDYENGTAPYYVMLSAYSEDGTSFTKEEGIRMSNVYEDEDSAFSLVGHGAFYELEDGSFGCLFSGNLIGDEGPSDLFMALSEDGLTWTINEEVLYDGYHDPTITKTEEGYVLYTGFLTQDIMRTVSPDGLTWPDLEKIAFVDENGEVVDSHTSAGDTGAVTTEDGGVLLYGNYFFNDKRSIAVHRLISN